MLVTTFLSIVSHFFLIAVFILVPWGFCLFFSSCSFLTSLWWGNSFFWGKAHFILFLNVMWSCGFIHAGLEPRWSCCLSLLNVWNYRPVPLCWARKCSFGQNASIDDSWFSVNPSAFYGSCCLTVVLFIFLPIYHSLNVDWDVHFLFYLLYCDFLKIETKLSAHLLLTQCSVSSWRITIFGSRIIGQWEYTCDSTL